MRPATATKRNHGDCRAKLVQCRQYILAKWLFSETGQMHVVAIRKKSQQVISPDAVATVRRIRDSVGQIKDVRAGHGQLREMGDVKYLLSPQDLMAVEMVPSLIEAGVGCFKIEGRLKGPEYVALTVSVYRKALDDAWAARDASATRGAKTEEWHLPEADRVDLAQLSLIHI